MRKTTVRYWICQVLGWGGWTLINLFFVYLFAPDMYLKPDDKKQVFHYELLGLIYSQAGRPQDAEKAYKMALEKDPARTNSDVALFNDYMRSGRTDDALKKLDYRPGYRRCMAQSHCHRIPAGVGEGCMPFAVAGIGFNDCVELTGRVVEPQKLIGSWIMKP